MVIKFLNVVDLECCLSLTERLQRLIRSGQNQNVAHRCQLQRHSLIFESKSCRFVKYSLIKRNRRIYIAYIKSYVRLKYHHCTVHPSTTQSNDPGAPRPTCFRSSHLQKGSNRSAYVSMARDEPLPTCLRSIRDQLGPSHGTPSRQTVRKRHSSGRYKGTPARHTALSRTTRVGPAGLAIHSKEITQAVPPRLRQAGEGGVVRSSQ